jgi:acetylornithine deacetylase/succinyl-diaminopimelate desuccinylase-like protein
MRHQTVRTTAVILTPCAAGIAHNNNERAELAYTAPGVNVLRHAAAARASR